MLLFQSQCTQTFITSVILVETKIIISMILLTFYIYFMTKFENNLQDSVNQCPRKGSDLIPLQMEYVTTRKVVTRIKQHLTNHH